MLVKMEKYIGGIQTRFTSPHGHHEIVAFVERSPECEISAAVLVDGECVYSKSRMYPTMSGINPETLASVIKHATGIKVEWEDSK